MKRRGQSAMEYMSTYGWAILVMAVVGIVLWQMGALNVSGKLPPGTSGFSVVKPAEWSMAVAGPASCTLSIRVANGAGETIESATIVGGNNCVPQTVLAGELTTCSIDYTSCSQPGYEYEKHVVISYSRSSDGQNFQSSGVLWGSAESI